MKLIRILFGSFVRFLEVCLVAIILVALVALLGVGIILVAPYSTKAACVIGILGLGLLGWLLVSDVPPWTTCWSFSKRILENCD
jgi:hypothetical protein